MFKRLYLTTFLIVIGFAALAQTYHIKGTIPGLANSEVYLVRAFAASNQIVDTAKTDTAGTFVMPLKDNWPVGMYRIITLTGQEFDLICNHENIAFATSGVGMNASFHILSSVENLMYYHYLGVKLDNQKKINLLRPVLNSYPHNDPFYEVLLTQAEKLQNQIHSVATQLIKDNPGTLAASFIKLDMPQMINFTLPTYLQNEAMKANYFNGIDFNDTLLLRADLFTGKIVGYLALFQSKGMTKPEVEDAFTPAVDTLMKKTVVNEKLYEFTLNYLLNGFEEFGFHKLLLHMADNSQMSKFNDKSPEAKELESKLYAIRTLAPGHEAPNFSARLLSGKRIELKDVKADTTLLVFWASWCPHCKEALPKLKKYYNPANTSHFQIIGISVDTDKKSVERAIKEEGYLWPNIAKLKGWDGPIAKLYGVNATPTFVLLDKNKRVIATPVTVEDLEKYLK
ncbi:MAG: redoxin domain-containing protein [Bacteroidales bacterium]|nr:redoxin domain-containing protein [Bacteroidales bacterium]